MIIVIIGMVILSFPFIRDVYNKVTVADKVLVVGEQVSDIKIDFIKEIKNVEKIIKYENMYDQIHFSINEWDAETYPDVILTINHKGGYDTHYLNIWIDENGGIALIPNTSGNNFAKLSKKQLEELKEIID